MPSLPGFEPPTEAAHLRLVPGAGTENAPLGDLEDSPTLVKASELDEEGGPTQVAPNPYLARAALERLKERDDESGPKIRSVAPTKAPSPPSAPPRASALPPRLDEPNEDTVDSSLLLDPFDARLLDGPQPNDEDLMRTLKRGWWTRWSQWGQDIVRIGTERLEPHAREVWTYTELALAHLRRQPESQRLVVVTAVVTAKAMLVPVALAIVATALIASGRTELVYQKPPKAEPLAVVVATQPAVQAAPAAPPADEVDPPNETEQTANASTSHSTTSHSTTAAAARSGERRARRRAQRRRAARRARRARRSSRSR